MKNIIRFSPLLLLISGCTVFGIVADASSNNRRQKQLDIIDEVHQNIVLQKTDGEEIEAVFLDFSYLSDTTDTKHITELTAEKSFPQIGDSVSLTLENGNSIQGIFTGLMHKDKHFEFIFRPAWSTMISNNYKFDDIIVITDMESDLMIDQPEEERIIVHYDAENKSGRIPLNDLSYLNKQSVKKRYTGTLVGLSLDAMTFYMIRRSIRNFSLDLEW